MDAYTFLAHGQVFANAQTGNVVLLAVSAAQADRVHAGRHVPPIIACALGVATAKLLGAPSSKHTFRTTLTCQTVEFHRGDPARRLRFLSPASRGGSDPLVRCSPADYELRHAGSMELP